MRSKYKYTFLIPSFLLILSGIWFAGAKEYEYIPFKSETDPFEIEMPVDSPPGKDNSFKLEEPENVEEEVEYDPETKRYTITKKVGGRPIGRPEFLSFDEYVKREFEKKEHKYWDDKLSTSSLLNRRGKSPLVSYDEEDDGLLNIGGDFIQITPNGSIDITLGGNYQKVDNPILTERLRRQGGFNFDMNIQANVVGNIGNLMKLNFNYNTKATFDFENQMKLAYNGKEDQIIRKIEAGNVSLPLRNSLITGSQNLFGIKTELQFGRLTVTSLISQQKSKNENIQIQGGAQTRTFRVETDNYDFNRHFFLAHFFRDQYEGALKNVPVITSLYNITNVEVWLTNRTRRQENARDIIAFMDMGEHDSIYNAAKVTALGTVNPSNNSNTLYDDVNIAEVRNTNTSINHLKNIKGYSQVVDFEKTNAIKLEPSQYSVHPQLGYISLNQTPNPDEVLAVAFEYTYRGKVYRVGQFAQDVAPGDNNENVLLLKMLKSTNLNPRLPMWNLMMKNIYSLNAYQVNPKDFFLDIYYQDPGGGEKRYIPAGPDSVKGVPLIRVLNMDKVNNQRDPVPDGVFDFIPGVTIEPRKGRLIFPVLEPFGDHLRKKFGAGNTLVANKYVYDQLYDSTLVIARQFPEFNRFLIQGTYKSSVSSEISLNKLNIPEGSVKVTAGGRVLQEGSDYTVDYLLGRVKIINTGIMESGIPVNVSFESTDLFGIQTKTLFGTRLDYWINDNFTLGATFLKLTERPMTQKVNFGNEPISNGMYGFDVNYQKGSELITRLIDKLPLIETKEKSTVTASAEYARLVPGHPKIIGKSGNTYIDNFEGTRSLFDLRMPVNAWKLASAPQNSKDASGNILFPEATLHDDPDYGKNRALLSWYRIDNLFTRNNSATPQHIKNDLNQQNNIYVRQILEQEVYPNKQNALGQITTLPTLDLAFYPKERGPYNLDHQNIDPATGALLNPRSRWGGIMQAINSSDFQAANVEYIEFWVLDPFLENPNNSGDLYINLGNISEDILKDGRRSWENGLPVSGLDTANVDTTAWGRVPQGQPIVNAFENDNEARKRQDVGYDGLSDDDERNHFKGFLDTIQSKVPNSVYQNLLNDPASDNYHYFRGEDYDAQQLPILGRYKKFSNPDGNSPTTENSPEPYPTSATNLPESEDINGDNTLSESEDYFQYRIRLSPDMQVGENFITDKIENTVKGSGDFYRWYQFQIPIEDWESKAGNIEDFKSIRFIRMFLTNFRDSTILRFARIGLVRNQWRRYQKSLFSPGDFQSPTHDNSENLRFNVSVVNIEENSERSPVRYVTPPGIVREQALSSLGNSVILQNEQSLSLEVCGMEDGDGRAVFKNIYLDMRSFKRLNMFIHAEEILDEAPLNEGDLTAFIRIGSDYVNNFYEYEIPLKFTNHFNTDPNAIWPSENIIDILLDSLAIVKQKRNFDNASFVRPYTIPDSKGNRITVVGSPDLSRVKTIMLGVRNPKATGVGNDDGMDKCGIVWFNELRLTDFDEQGGSAALARVDVQMADLGNIAVSGNTHTAGFGGIEEQISNRFRDDFYQYDVSSSLELGKLFSQKSGISIPMFAGITKSLSNPQYDPYNSDLKMEEVYEVFKDDKENNKDKIDSINNTVRTTNTVKSFNLSNVRKTSSKPKKKIYDIENVNLTYSYTETEKTDPIIESDKIKMHRGIVAYNYAYTPKNYRPFQKLVNSKWAYLKFLRDFNFNLLPSNISLQTEMNRQFGELQLRTIGDDQFNIDPTYNKYFTWDRTAAIKYNFSRSLTADFSAATNARIDEPFGKIDTEEKKDTLWSRIMEFGRITNYQHRVNASYKLPFDKFPITNWINVDLKYGSDYAWITAPLSVTEWGNTIRNSRRFQINGTANTRTLYSNIQKLGNQIERVFEGDPKKKGAENEGAKKKNDKKKNQKSFAGKTFESLVTAVRSLSANYTNDRGTTVPGFMRKPDFIGQSFDRSGSAPGYDFLFGYQPDTSWLTRNAALGWFTDDTLLNYQFLQTSVQDLNIRASVEPIQSLRIDITFKRSFSETYNEFFRFVDPVGYMHQSPQRMGNFNTTFIMWNTMFDSRDANGVTNTFKQFQENRLIISRRLGEENGNTNPHDSIPIYTEGYGPVSQNVLIPAFLSAYTGKGANEYPINQPFNKMPLPNWRVSYNGLSKLPLFKAIFSNFAINHGYISTYNVNSFSSSQIYTQRSDSLNPLTKDFYPQLEIAQINLTEQLSPLLGVDMQFKNNMNMNFSYNLSRSLNMSFLNYQLTEARTKEIKFGFGYKIRGLKLPGKMRIAGSDRLKNDLNVKLDFILRDMENRIHRLDQDYSPPISGMYSISILPSADYRVNRNIDLRLFLDWRKTIPAVSSSFPITSMNGGITFRYTLTP